MPCSTSWTATLCAHALGALRSGFSGRHETPPVTGFVGRDLRAYADYFGSLAARENVTLTGDFSPVYADLSESMLRNTVAALETRGMTVKAIYLMRDPVERAWSAVRMHRKKPEKFSHQLAQAGERSEEEHLLRMAATPAFRKNGDYRGAVTRLRRVFGETHLHLGLYEELFQMETINTIGRFLDMPLKAPDFDRNTNPSPKTAQLSVAAQEKLAAQMQDANAFGVETFGQERIATLWPAAARLLTTPHSA